MKIRPTEFSSWMARFIKQPDSVRELAKKTGVSHPTLYRLAHGGSPELETLERLGVVLEVPKA